MQSTTIMTNVQEKKSSNICVKLVPYSFNRLEHSLNAVLYHPSVLLFHTWTLRSKLVIKRKKNEYSCRKSFDQNSKLVCSDSEIQLSRETTWRQDRMCVQRSLIRVFARNSVRSEGSKAILCGQRKLWSSAGANAQDDLSSRLAHMQSCWKWVAQSW